MRRDSTGSVPGSQRGQSESLFDFDSDPAFEAIDGDAARPSAGDERAGHGRAEVPGAELSSGHTAAEDFEDGGARAASALDDGDLAFDAESDAAGELVAGPRRRAMRPDAARRQNLPLRLVLGGGVIFVVSLLVTAGGKGYRDLQIIQQREAEVSARIVAAEERLEDLRHRIQLLREDPATLERLAREELGLVGPDDIVFVLPDAAGP
jgi:cell division protein FtsB